jgi:hypothetical protein
MNIEDGITDLVSTAEFDPAFIMMLKTRLITTGLWEKMGCPAPIVKRQGPPPGAPHVSNITAIQTALWDNWPDGVYVKKNPNRYGFAIEIWDAPADDIEAYKVKAMNYTFKGNVGLMDRKALKAQVKHLRKPRVYAVDTGYLDALDAIADNLQPGTTVGLLNVNIKDEASEYNRGTFYPAYQFVVVTMDGGKVEEARLFIDGDPIALAPFVNTDFVGKPLGRNVKAQSRLDVVGFSDEWATNESDSN